MYTYVYRALVYPTTLHSTTAVCRVYPTDSPAGAEVREAKEIEKKKKKTDTTRHDTTLHYTTP